MVQGKVSLREIGSKKFETDFSEADAWVKEALKLAAPHEELTGLSAEEWMAASRFSGHVRIDRLDPEYTVEGNFTARVPLLCPRCAAEGTVSREGTFRLFVTPQSARETNEMGDDPDYIFLETPWLDLSSILAEQLVAAEFVVERPDQNMSGAAHVCEVVVSSEAGEQNPAGTGQNDAIARNSPFAVLGQLKDSDPVKRGK